MAPQIFTCARHWPRLASAHQKPGRWSPKNFKGEHLKLALKFHICAPITLGVVGINSQNFARVMSLIVLNNNIEGVYCLMLVCKKSIAIVCLYSIAF